VTDAEFALFHLHRALRDPVDPRLVGSLLPELQFRVNGEVYRFANERNLQRFMRTPDLFCGVVRDPVTAHRFLPSANSPQAYWVGGPYFFESESTKAAFVDDPQRFQVLREM
jgi:YHS domain-containing protein